MTKVTISRETFSILLSLSRVARDELESRKNMAVKNGWKNSADFWEAQFQQASDVYDKALEESIYS